MSNFVTVVNGIRKVVTVEDNVVKIVMVGVQGPPGESGLQGIPGISAYESAVAAGYIGTEVAFNADLAAIEGLASELGGI